MYRSIADCKKALRECDTERDYIENIRELGYHFAADNVRLVPVADSAPPISDEAAGTVENGAEELSPHRPAADSIPSIPIASGHSLHVHVASALYGFLFGVMLIVEIAYQFDQYGKIGILVASMASLWMYAASVAGLCSTRKLTKRGSPAGLAAAIAVFLGAAVVLFLSVAWFLPTTPDMQQTVQASTAQAAYLKTIVYNTLRALPFLIIPFHLIIAQQVSLRTNGQRRHCLVAPFTSSPGYYWQSCSCTWCTTETRIIP